MRRLGRVYFDELEERNLLAFAPSVPYSTGSAPHHLVSSDFNSDGNPDLAVAASGSDQISILMGLGNGTFQAGTPLTVNDEPFHVEAADFNADGKIDLAVPNYGSDLLSVMLGNGNGTFQARVDYAAGSFPTAVDSGDLNGDGKLDLVVVNNLGQSARVMLGNGNGTFQAGVSYGIHQSFGVALGDFNSDGKLDVAASGYVAGVVSVLLGNGNGTLQPRVDYTVGPSPYNVALADFDRDGDLDIATSAYGANYVSVLKGAGNGTFPERVDVPTGTHPLGVTTADYNMDGKLDLAVALAEPNPDTTYSVGVLHGNGNGSFQPQTLYNVGINPFAITSGDFNRDGAADLAAANELSANASVLLNTDPVTNSSIASSVWNDVDSDGQKDAGEPGIANAVVELFATTDHIAGNGDDVSLGTRITDASGNYTFGTVPPGLYSLEFRAPVGYTFTTADAGGNDAIDSDASPSTGRTSIFVLGTGTSDTTRAAGLVGAAPGFGWAIPLSSIASEEGQDITTDAAGNHWVSGRFNGTVDFDPGPGTTLRAPMAGNDAYVARYTPAGALVWVRQFGGLGSRPSSRLELAVDANGNVAMTGYFTGTVDFNPAAGVTSLTSAGGDDIFIAKLTSDGQLAWAYGLGGSNQDQGKDIATDAAGNVLVTGYFTNATVDFDPSAGSAPLTSSGSQDVFIIKFSPAGAFQWVKAFSGDLGDSIATDAAGNVYTTGFFTGDVDFDPGPGAALITADGFGPATDTFISKLTSNGNFVWVRTFGGLGSAAGTAISLSATAEVYVAGEFIGAFDTDSGPATQLVSPAGLRDVFVAKFDTSGNQQWIRTFGGANSEDANDLQVSSSGKVYLVGRFFDTVDFDPSPGTFELTSASAGMGDAFLTTFDASGAFLTAKRVGGSNDDSATGVAIDAGDNAYVTGYYRAATDFDPGAGNYTLNNAGSLDTFILRLSPDAAVGSRVWSDLDSDGIQDAGEPGMSGVVVELFNSADGIIGNGNDLSLGTQTTDASGNYSFANVTAGSYYLRFRKPSGYIFSPRDAGVDDALDSDANYFGFTEVFTLAAGQNDSSRDAGLRSAADRIVFASNRDGDFDIWEMDTSGANVLQLLNVAGTDNNGSWSPNGDKLLFSSDRDGDPEIYVMNADGSGVTKLTNNTSLDSGPVWSPDGSKIAFVSQRDGNYEIYVMNADGTNQTRLTTNAAQDLAPDWSPDGSRLVFYSDRTGGGDIYVVSATGGTPTRLTTSTASDTTPHFSPDGTKIAFDSARDGDDEIWVMNADGSSQTQLTFNTQFDQGPRWSPDGSKLVFYRDFGVNREVFVMNANGSSETNISNHTAADDNPTWSQKAVGSLGNFVWNDLDGDGIQDAGEPGMPGVTVSVYTQAVGGTTVATTTTNGSGLYTFNALAAQTYYVEVSLPSGYYVSPQDQGNDDALDSDFNPGSRRTGPVVLSAQQSMTDIDAGLSQAALQVVSLTSTATGFIAHFNRELDPSQLNLYDEGGVLGPSDLTLTGNSTGSVRGSAVVDPGLRRITFIATHGTLPPDTYAVVLKSGANAFKDSQGGLLDGNRDGTTGDDYLGNLTLGNPTPGAITLTAPNVTRGYGQPVNLPASAPTGLPIAISNAQGVKSASFMLHYNPALLSITAAAAGPGISGNVTLDTSMPGMAIVTVTSATQLSATSGSKTLVQLTASVPSDAPYGSKQILDLANIALFDTSPVPVELPSIDDDGVHIAAYFGDANGSQSYNAPDATAVQRLIVGTNSGLSAYQLADPHLIVDISGNSHVQSDDVTQIQRAIVGSSTAEIPPLPGLPSVSPGGADPLLYIPQDLVATQGETLVVPVSLLVTEPAGIILAGADVAIAYDPAVLQLDRVSAGALMIGFGLNVNAAAPGVIRLSLGGGAPLYLPHDSSGILAQLQFTVIAGAGNSTPLNLLAASEQLQTALYDDLGRALTLVPAPTNDDDDAVDGRLRIRPASLSDQGAALDQAFAGEREWRHPEDFEPK